MEISKSTRKKNVDYITSDIEKVIKTFGDRDPGSEGERKAQKYMASELEKYTDNVTIEDFKVYPASFFGWIPILIVLVMLSAVCFFFLPILSIVLIVLGMALMLIQFVLYIPFTDKMYPEKTSCNVMAVKKPAGEVKRRIIFGGHADATWEWTVNYKFGGVAFIAEFLISMIGVGYLFALSVYSLIMNGIGLAIPKGVMLYLGFALVIFFPFWILMFWFSNSKLVVPGANDNLSACYMSIAILKALQEEGINLENTEVCALLTGSEESGLRGAKAWAAKHKDDYKDCETILIPFETLRELNHITIYKKDLNGLQPVDKDVCDLIHRAGLANGIDIHQGAVTLGATDAAAFAQAGFKTACLAALDHNLKDYYHTRRDNYDNLSEECLSKVLDIAITTLDIFDKQGLSK